MLVCYFVTSDVALICQFNIYGQYIFTAPRKGNLLSSDYLGYFPHFFTRLLQIQVNFSYFVFQPKLQGLGGKIQSNNNVISIFRNVSYIFFMNYTNKLIINFCQINLANYRLYSFLEA